MIASGPPTRTLIDLFAGCGGMSLGLESAGFRPLLVAELNDSARGSYLANRTSLTQVDVQAELHNAKLDRSQLVVCKDVKDLSPKRLKLLMAAWRRAGIDEIDVLAGGPPCQGFSTIGHRRTHDVERRALPSNHLYKAMVDVIDQVTPRLFVFENVRGILTARWEDESPQGGIWEDVRAEFHSRLDDRYVIRWDLLNAKNYKVPQNRPRVLMVGLRRDCFPAIAKSTTAESDREALRHGFLPPGAKDLPPSVEAVLGDLLDRKWTVRSQITRTESYPSDPVTDYQRRMRTDPSTGQCASQGAALVEHEYSYHSAKVLQRFRAMLDDDHETIKRLETKKFSQRAIPREWGEAGPTITITSLPDDYVHYHQPRILTVREWARMQGFPDWYKFSGPRTTGGAQRAGKPLEGIWRRQVPRYTQIGNAVPVMLAEALGNHFKGLLAGEVVPTSKPTAAHAQVSTRGVRRTLGAQQPTVVRPTTTADSRQAPMGSMSASSKSAKKVPGLGRPGGTQNTRTRGAAGEAAAGRARAGGG